MADIDLFLARIHLCMADSARGLAHKRFVLHTEADVPYTTALKKIGCPIHGQPIFFVINYQFNGMPGSDKPFFHRRSFAYHPSATAEWAADNIYYRCNV